MTFPDDGSPLVTVNGYTSNRAGYFVTTHTSVKRDDRLVTATVKFTSTAPSGPPSILLGRTRGDTAGKPLGTFGAEITLYMPPGSQQVKDTVDGELSYPFEGRLFGRPTITEVPLVHARRYLDGRVPLPPSRELIEAMPETPFRSRNQRRCAAREPPSSLGTKCGTW